MSEEIWIPLAVMGGIFLLTFLAVMAACLWEKRPVQPYYVPEPGTEYPPTDAARAANRTAERLGFEKLGVCHDGKGSLYKVRYDFWISEDHTILLDVGGGTVAKLPVNGIWIYSRLIDGPILCTTNEIGEQDISGAEEQKTWAGYTLEQLLEKHRPRLVEQTVQAFPADSPLRGFMEIRRCKADALVNRGYAKFLDEEQTVWRYNLKGALAFYFISVWVRPIKRFFRMLGLAKA